VPATTPVIPVARLVTELSITGVGQLALGLAVLAVGLTSTDVDPVRILVPFAVVFAVVCGLSLYQTRWLRQAPTPTVDPDARVEELSDTTRRSLVHIVPAIVAVAVCTIIAPAVGVIVGGVVAAVGLIDLRNRAWAQQRERDADAELMRELGRSPFTPGRRPLYTRPRKASTLRT
jgi:ABC-type Fe3+ transport system permease subunit